jgi:hypothetical protein
MPSADPPKMGRQEKLKVLLVAGNWWPAAARLAAALAEHGCEIAAVCPPGHPLRYISRIGEIHNYSCLDSHRSLLRALRQVKPDLVVPCDDRSVTQLHQMYRDHAELRVLIERSLGDPRGFDAVESRGALLTAARALGIRVADTTPVDSAADVAAAYAACGPTALLKVDGTGGGQGVQIVHSEAEALAAFRRLRSAAGLPTALKRLAVNRDPQALWFWAQRSLATMSMQRFVRGTPANIMAACWQGTVIADVAVRAISCQGPTGASLVVRVIENEELSQAAAQLARHLGISGFFGLDFMLAEANGAAHLIEMNPRCTQLGHLKLPAGDLAGAFCAALGGRTRPKARHPITTDTIAFFPQAWQWGAPNAFRDGVHHDVPWEEKRLIEILMQAPWPDRQWSARLYHAVRRPAVLQAVESATDIGTS